MAPRTKSRFWRICGIYFRRFRMGMWLVILLVLGSLLYLNQIGLPGIVKKPLLEKLRAHGVDLQFTRLRWRFDRGIVAENVRFGGAAEASTPQFYVREVEVELDYKALSKLKLQVKGLLLRQGHLFWTVPETNGPPRELAVEKIQTELHLLPGDLWQLDHFQAEFAGADIRLAGMVTNASKVRDWKMMRAGRPSPVLLENRLRRLADILEEIHFSAPPELNVDVRGDANNLRSFSLRFDLKTPGADTPWGKVQDGSVSLLLHPESSNNWSHAELNLQAASAQSRWANSTNLELVLHMRLTGVDTNVVECDLDVAGANVDTKWGQADRAHLKADWISSLAKPMPVSGHGELEADQPITPWGRAGRFHLAGALLPSTNGPVATDESWAWWTNLAPFSLDLECQVRGVQSPRLTAEDLSCTAEWRPPQLTATRVAGKLYGGKLDAQADLNVATRELNFSADSDFDALKVSPLLDAKSREWLAQFTWQKPPVVKGEGAVVLPAWTNLQGADFATEVRPSLRLGGQFHITDGTFRAVPFSSGESHFSYSNECWTLPDVMAVRPEGRLFLFHRSSDLTGDFYFRFGSTINLRVLRPLLAPAAQREFDLLAFTRTPVVDGEVWGRWRDADRTGLRTRVALTNFTVRGETASDFQSLLLFTNGVLRLVEPRLHRGAQQVTATSLDVDFNRKKIYLTNGFSTADPQVIARAIGPQVGRVLEPYRFLQPPTIHAQGVVPMRSERDAELYFDVEGGAFEWWKFRLQRITGKVDWVGDKLALRDMDSSFYRGSATGHANFDFSGSGQGADFNFNVVATDADMHLLMNDLTGKSNKLEGLVSIRLAVSEGNSEDWQRWQGKGRVNLRDGLIWDIPVFGIFSPVLDGIMPGLGLGSSRASEASATYIITNGVVITDDLEIRASKLRLQYWGSVNLQGDVNGRAQAELLRDTLLIGPILSFVLWPVAKVFEYKVTGTLEQPRSEPVFFVPRVLLSPFRPAPSSKGPTAEDGPGSIRMSPPPTITP